MEGKPTAFVYSIIILLIVIVVIIIITTMIFGQSMDVTKKTRFAGAPGVVKADSYEITYKDSGGSGNVYDLILTMMDVEHEEGKKMKVAPIIIVGDRVRRAESAAYDYPAYPIPGSIQGYFYGLYLDNIGNEIHVSLWEAACIDTLGDVMAYSFQYLVNKCDNSYLASFYAKPVKSFACDGNAEDECNKLDKCYFSEADGKCMNCNDVPTDCNAITEKLACSKCRRDVCKWEQTDPSDPSSAVCKNK